MEPCTIIGTRVIYEDVLPCRRSTTSSKAPNLHHDLPIALTHNHTRLPPKRDLPHRLCPLRDVPDVLTRAGTRAEAEEPRGPVAPARHDEAVARLERSDRVVVCGEALDDVECWRRR